MTYTVRAPHPDFPHRMVGITLDAFDDATASDLALALFTTYTIPGIYLPTSTKYPTHGLYLVPFTYNTYQRLTTLHARSLGQAKLIMNTLAEDGTLIYSDAPIA